MPARMTGAIAMVVCAVLVGACATVASAGWTMGPTISTGSSPSPANVTTSPTASPADAIPSIAPSPTPDGRAPLAYPDVQSYGAITIAFTRPALPSIELALACAWASPTETASLDVSPRTVSLGGEEVSLYFEPRSPGYGFRIERVGAASYGPGRLSGVVGLTRLGEGWASGTMWFDFTMDPQVTGPLDVPVEAWIRPLGGDPRMRWLQGTITWVCEPAPATVEEPEAPGPMDPNPTFPLLPRLPLVTGNLQRDAVSGCGASIEIDGYSGSDSCGPSFQALGVDYIVRVRPGENLRFVLPEGWRFERWSLGWVGQVDAERWHGGQPDTFETIRTGESTNGRVLEVNEPPVGDWSVRLDWTGVRGDDSFTVPDYFRVLVE